MFGLNRIPRPRINPLPSPRNPSLLYPEATRVIRISPSLASVRMQIRCSPKNKKKKSILLVYCIYLIFFSLSYLNWFLILSSFFCLHDFDFIPFLLFNTRRGILSTFILVINDIRTYIPLQVAKALINSTIPLGGRLLPGVRLIFQLNWAKTFPYGITNTCSATSTSTSLSEEKIEKGLYGTYI